MTSINSVLVTVVLYMRDKKLVY